MVTPQLGNVVLTHYGVGIVTEVFTKDSYKNDVVVRDADFFKCSLWRIPGKSVGSCSTAFLRSDSIIKTLPVSPGMKTKVKDDQSTVVMVHCYSPQIDKFLVLTVDDDDDESNKNNNDKGLEKRSSDFRWVYPHELEHAKSAKFYPLFLDLIQRGNQAAASASTLLNKNKKISTLVEKTSNVIQEQKLQIIPNHHQKSMEEISKNISEKTKSIPITVPNANEVKDVYKMLKDEELTVLLEKGRERLEQLVSQDIPKTTLTALREVGIEIQDFSTSSALSSIEKSRKQALTAIDQLLSETLDMNIETIQGTIVDNFADMLDSFASAAKSDMMLNTIFETVNGKTLEWQEHTGRLLQTRSVSLFFEGSRRIQSRVEGLLSSQQLAWAKESRAKLTKAFTEGDVAMTRLKSIELGDAVRKRLFAAIEIRSDTYGGLDGIIAGALTTISDNSLGQSAIDQAQIMLAELQKTASSKTKETNESLLAMISQKSLYRDLALLRIEEVFCHIDSQLEDGISAEEIAQIASGEGGTAALLQPIAKRAAKEIEKQLDEVEKSVTDPTILSVLSHVRKIISGNMNMSNLMDEITAILNDEKIVAVGENLALKGEELLDVLENASDNKIVSNVIQAAEKAGFTKENMMDRVTNLDVNNILDTAESAISDEQKRIELISSATDSALDFLLRILPSMPVPPLDGVKDGLLYHISNLSMEGFKVKKEDIFVEIAGISAVKTANSKRFKENSDVNFSNGTNKNDKLNEMNVRSADILVIDIQNISAILDKAFWSFEQTYFPYVKGSGEANIKLSGGHIKLHFELRKRQTVDDSPEPNVSWVPVLCLHERFCEIEEVNLSLEGEGRMTWIFNKLASIFQGLLRAYVIRTILNVMSNRSGWLLERLNKLLGNYWNLILKTANLSIDDLAEASEEDIIAATPDPYENEVDLVWRDHVPLGMNLLMNDESGLIRVVDFPRGSQSRKVASNANFDPKKFEGAIIVAVNGTRYSEDEKEELFDALKDPGRPKTIRFRLVGEEEVNEMREFLSRSESNTDLKSNTNQTTLQSETSTTPVELMTIEIRNNEPLGIVFAKALDNFALVVQDIKNGSCTHSLSFKQNGKRLQKGLLLSHVNQQLVMGKDGTGIEEAVSLLESEGIKRPLSLTFVDPYHELLSFHDSESFSIKGGPEELVLEIHKEGTNNLISINGFRNVDGMAETMGAVIGDRLLFVNGERVGVGCSSGKSPSLDELLFSLRNPDSYPMALTFGRENQGISRWAGEDTTFDVDTAFTFCVTIDSFDELGCTIGIGTHPQDFIINSFNDVMGPFQRRILTGNNSKSYLGLIIESINGEVVPSYATCDLVMNVMKRRWTAEKNIQILVRNDQKKKMIEDIASP